MMNTKCISSSCHFYARAALDAPHGSCVFVALAQILQLPPGTESFQVNKNTVSQYQILLMHLCLFTVAALLMERLVSA